MPRIFLSYRRRDTAGVAGRIFDRLRAKFGDDSVVMDIDSIPFGVDFREFINAEVARCDILLVLIGPRWLGKTGKVPRIDDPKDFVRIEIEAALQRNIPVIPVRIDRVRMPAETDLPPSLSPLAFRNAIEVDQGRDFHVHVDRLIRGIEFHLRTKSPGSPDRPPEPEPRPPPPEGKWTNSLGMTFVRIEPGSFLMGSTKAQIEELLRLFPNSRRELFDGEQPQHPIKMTWPYTLGIYQVTQGQYQAIMGGNPSHFKGSDDLPVESATWFEAVEFCNNLSKKEKRTQYYRIGENSVTTAGGNGYRLPTEAEWEFACRAGSASLFPWGDDKALLDNHAWNLDNSSGRSHPVGQKKPNAWGLHDMLGNVWEWCDNWYDEKYHGSSPSAAHPWGAARHSAPVFRGGSWYYFAWYCRPAYRVRLSRGHRGSDMGFRVAAVQS